jgi:hypothetical protein
MLLASSRYAADDGSSGAENPTTTPLAPFTSPDSVAKFFISITCIIGINLCNAQISAKESKNY